jgi:metallo-beta-lactamase family protein
MDLITSPEAWIAFATLTALELVLGTLASGSGIVRIHSKDIQIEAEVVQLQSSSAHADASQLIDWLQSMKEPPSQVYVVHGEPEASDALRQKIEHKLGWRALVPEHGSTWPT